jgi:hypothetical protein
MLFFVFDFDFATFLPASSALSLSSEEASSLESLDEDSEDTGARAFFVGAVLFESLECFRLLVSSIRFNCAFFEDFFEGFFSSSFDRTTFLAPLSESSPLSRESSSLNGDSEVTGASTFFGGGASLRGFLVSFFWSFFLPFVLSFALSFALSFFVDEVFFAFNFDAATLRGALSESSLLLNTNSSLSGGAIEGMARESQNFRVRGKKMEGDSGKF